MEVAIRPYAASDSDAVTAIWLASWQSTGVPSPVTLADLRERWPKELAKGWQVHVATSGPEVIGFCAVDGDTLEQLFIAPAHQSRGVGKRMLDFVKSCRPGGFKLHTALNTRAPNFYDREGLTRGELGINPRFGHPIVHYAWDP